MDPVDKIQLQLLRLYFHNLPALKDLPYHATTDSRYMFDMFAIGPEWETDIGREGAVNRELEVHLGSCANGPILLIERGPGLESVVNGSTRMLLGTTTLTKASTLAERTQFTVGGLHETIDLDTHYLHDLLNDTAISQPIATVTTEAYGERTKTKNGGEASLVVPEASERDEWVI